MFIIMGIIIVVLVVMFMFLKIIDGNNLIKR